MVRLLLQHGASPNVVGFDRVSPLIYAVFGGYVEIVELLLAAGADKYQQAADGYNAYHYAVKYRRTSIIDLFEGHDHAGNEKKDRPRDLAVR